MVSKLKRGEKLNTRFYRFTIEPTSMFSPAFFVRWVNGESRDQTIDALDTLVTSCINQNGLSQTETDDLVEQLIASAKGIQNLAETYKDDSTACSGIEVVLGKIVHFIGRYGRSLDEGKGSSASASSSDGESALRARALEQ